jgi:membrane dipeptidase
MSEEERALRLHKAAIVVDSHCDTLLRMIGVDPWTGGKKEPADLRLRSTEGQMDIPRMIEGGVDVQIFAAWTESRYKEGLLPLKRGMQMIDAFHSEMDRLSDKILFAKKTEDVYKAVKENKIAALLALEGGEPLVGDLGVLRMMYKLGVRAITLTWNERNKIADGVGERRTKGGLTNFGVQVIEEMNNLGMMIDVSHLSDSSFYDVLKTTKKPIIASHSNCRSLSDHPRNLADDQIKLIGENGGMIGVVFSPGFIDRNKDKQTVERLVDHIDHIKSLIGVDHVGIGSDFDGFTGLPKGLEDVTKMPNITKILVKRGYSDKDILKILGENYLGLFKKVIG